MEIGEAMGKTVLDLAKNDNVLNKTVDFLGMLFPYAGLRKRALDMYLSDIEKSDLPSESKLIAVIDAKKTIKKLRNQKRIAEIAINNAKEGTDFTEKSGVSEEWLDRFMDSAGFVSTEDIQLIWGKILSKEFENPGSIPLNMRRILSEITPVYAQAFKKICSMQVAIIEIDNQDNIIGSSTYVIVPYSENSKEMDEMGLSLTIVNELETLGLIKLNALTGYMLGGFSEQTILIYVNNETIEIVGEKAIKMPSGEIVLTAVGKCLKEIISLETIDGYYNMIKRYMEKRDVKLKEESNYRIFKRGNEIHVERK